VTYAALRATATPSLTAWRAVLGVSLAEGSRPKSQCPPFH
jgi:hypothetical protein